MTTEYNPCLHYGYVPARILFDTRAERDVALAIIDKIRLIAGSRLPRRHRRLLEEVLSNVRRSALFEEMKADIWDAGWDSGNFYAIDEFNRDGRNKNPYRSGS